VIPVRKRDIAVGAYSLAGAPITLKSAALLAEADLRIARQRMRHLVPWNVEPLPLMHSVVGTPNEPRTLAQRDRTEHLAIQVLAVQMWQAAATSALD